MAILDGDIQILKSEVLDDVPEGGGMATGIALVDGVSNNLFPDISELDRTFGRVALRKIYPGVVTDNTDTYAGTNLIVAKPPADPKVSVTLFTTKSWSDHRDDARNKLESYLSASSEGRWMLYGNHLAGQRTLQMHCAHSVASPTVDAVLVLIKSQDTSAYQYVRVSRLVAREENVAFEDAKGGFLRDVITLEISDALRIGFSAAAMERYTDGWYRPPTRLHTTVAADAASYYGVQPLKFAANLGDLTIKAQSIYTQLVPSALAETPIVDARCASDRTVIVPIAGAPALSFISMLTTSAGATTVRYFGQSVGRGSVSISLGGVTVPDDGDGSLVPTSGYTGTVDYEAGSVAIAHASGMAISATFAAAPACAVALAGHTDSTEITVGNRGYTYIKTLLPVPAPGSVIVSFMAQGQWYSLYDDGAGELSGDEGTGLGSVNYATGSVVLTLGALPDADTQILFGWGSPTHFASHVGSSVFAPPGIKFTIAGGALEPGALDISYLAGGITKTVSDNGAGGFTGDGSGYVDYANGVVVINPSMLPDSGSDLAVNYQQGGPTAETFSASGAVNNFTLANPVKPGTLSLSFLDDKGNAYIATDNATGELVLKSVKTSAANLGLSTVLITSAGISGSVNYSTGAVSLAASITVKNQYQTGYVWQESTQIAVATGGISATYRVASDAAGGVQTVAIPLPALSIDLLPSIANALVPGSLAFTLAGHTYVDRAGTLIKDPNSTTNSGLVAGVVNYTNGVATLTDYTGGGAPSATVSCLTRKGIWTDWRIKFRTAGAPLQSASLYVSANRSDTSAMLSATAAGNGDIDGTLVDGYVDSTTGIVSLRFGEMVMAAGNEAEWWYAAGDIVGGQIFKPQMVLPDTAKYSAVAVSSLPLSADILGLDPVRLPVDGRVAIYRPGDVVVVHHTATTAPETVTNGQAVNLGRVRLAKVRVIGNDGLAITAGYTPDLDAGTVLFTAVSGYAQPIHIEHRIEDMAVVADVQINGELRLSNRALTHDFPLGSYVSSALIISDLRARVSAFFDQGTWTGWYDTLQGNAATGTYNKTQFPPVVTNRGAIEERWEIIFTNSTTVNVIGETVGQILTAVPISQVIAPLNPAQAVPYFSLDPLGWGSGWSAGNVLRFNTVAANYPVWCARTVLQGNPTTTNDQFTLGVRGDVDA